jgi:hypothetical protein
MWSENGELQSELLFVILRKMRVIDKFRDKVHVSLLYGSCYFISSLLLPLQSVSLSTQLYLG